MEPLVISSHLKGSYFFWYGLFRLNHDMSLLKDLQYMPQETQNLLSLSNRYKFTPWWRNFINLSLLQIKTLWTLALKTFLQTKDISHFNMIFKNDIFWGHGQTVRETAESKDSTHFWYVEIYFFESKTSIYCSIIIRMGIKRVCDRENESEKNVKRGKQLN